jgi:hypothetical protein
VDHVAPLISQVGGYKEEGTKVMKHDPCIRDRHVEAPLVPGTIRRFRWPEEYDDDVALIRDNVQEGGGGMYILRLPEDMGKCVVEAHYPEDIRSDYAAFMLDPYRRHDMGLGNLVVVHLLFTLGRTITWNHIDEIRRNNRAANKDLKRVSAGGYRKLELADDHEAADEQTITRFVDWYEEAVRDTLKFAMTPHVGPYRSSSLRQ